MYTSRVESAHYASDLFPAVRSDVVLQLLIAKVGRINFVLNGAVLVCGVKSGYVALIRCPNVAFFRSWMLRPRMEWKRLVCC